MKRIKTAFKAWQALGTQQMMLIAAYRLAQRTGYYEARERDVILVDGPLRLDWVPIPEVQALRDAVDPSFDRLIADADRIVKGEVCIFGAIPAPIDFSHDKPLRHWRHYESGTYAGKDIKFTWEPARFGWVHTLTRAYLLTGNDVYREAFWGYLAAFTAANPPNRGPHWASAQEVGLRLINLVWAGAVFLQNSPGEKGNFLAQIIADHAVRIPDTLLYARAQNNNHLLTEAAALVTAAVVLPQHPKANQWAAEGWRWFHHALQTQIEPDGTYVQQSTNYHRLMLQAAMLGAVVAAAQNKTFPARTKERLAAATQWLQKLLDPYTGRVPNLGANDGAYIFPLTTLDFSDYRPVVQAASRVFLGKPALLPGPWDEMSLWLAPNAQFVPPAGDHEAGPRTVLRHPGKDSWVCLRAAQFSARPSHADQLHLDLWWQGHNLAKDPGTYLYNGTPPWDNALTHAGVHNTVTIDGCDQMTRAGRFLYLDWAQAEGIEVEKNRMAAAHNGYRRFGLTHRRIVEANSAGWQVVDEISYRHNNIRDHTFRDEISYRHNNIEDRIFRDEISHRHNNIRDHTFRDEISHRHNNIEDRIFRDEISHRYNNIEGHTFRDEISHRHNNSNEHTLRLHWLLPDWLWILDGTTLRLQAPQGQVELVVSNDQDIAMDSQLYRGGERLDGRDTPAGQPTWGWYSPTYGSIKPTLAWVLTLKTKPPIKLLTAWRLP